MTSNIHHRSTVLLINIWQAGVCGKGDTGRLGLPGRETFLYGTWHHRVSDHSSMPHATTAQTGLFSPERATEQGLNYSIRRTLQLDLPVAQKIQANRAQIDGYNALGGLDISALSLINSEYNRSVRSARLSAVDNRACVGRTGESGTHT